MSATTRRGEILQRLHVDGYVEAKVLSRELGVDASTIRRDLDTLVRSGQAERTHGGARPVTGASSEIPYAVKKTERRPEKIAIARRAAQHVADGDTIILDSGSTTYQVALELRHKADLTIITNDLRIGKYVATIPAVRLLVTGGELLGSVFTLVGERAVDFLSDYSADWAFLGADAIDPTAGITNTNTLEVPLKRAIISAAARTIVLADSSKFGHRALAKVAAIDEVETILTDSGLPSDQAEQYGGKVARAMMADD
ncbi:MULTISPECIES: DeoR/GlpR family DNA-binding transcription regulator [Rhodococcus]|uniref:Lactose phosphotransferase system repressor n=1 Tax=Rhodococcus oxybenzonivorans TaxID=1990687 RepID=A0AAE5A907_9NOCA|nr:MULTISPECIES: DeoR/GlpR family DNA-binding transcription regulator [Rhodococcus]MDV7243230.1 DeoR/GlpR family DNA-binding transcription regulator [Rhodococcus oxybenzonivorans]MDV7268565.1 DeoR/GlpR family DNA-binding transcription regulator [Rhodococcus oxybenzonivorans]MDV7278022.1 DeoR/GlpR family DNA-binding transcription regulator [Rhodococcus oxybenzonivorans]MDV7334511.1 DeoR/GlpR family DNA-binding transcription regulator [Rhodococcus oxybenzonivorans]MDV7344665.1 DeoR/GlpR family D